MNKIEILKEKIKSGKFPNKFEHFGGANLIITDDPNRKGYPQDMVIYTEHASAISWLIFELKDIYNEKIDYMNKYDFYPYIGKLIQSSINTNDDLLETMLFVIEKMEEYYFS